MIERSNVYRGSGWERAESTDEGHRDRERGGMNGIERGSEEMGERVHEKEWGIE